MQCGNCGAQCFPNGSFWQCPGCGALYPKTWSMESIEQALKLSYKDTHGWYFVQPNGHLFTIANQTLWATKEAAIEAINRMNEERVKV